MEKIIDQDTVYHGNEWPELYGKTVRMTYVVKNALATSATPDDGKSDIFNDEELAKAGGLGELDRVCVTAWLEESQRFTEDVYPVKATDLEYMQKKRRVKTVIGQETVYLGRHTDRRGQRFLITRVAINRLGPGFPQREPVCLCDDLTLAEHGGLGPYDEIEVRGWSAYNKKFTEPATYVLATELAIFYER